MSDDLDNVVPFPRGQFERDHNRHGADLEALPVHTKRERAKCRHRHSTVSEGDRTVECRDCGVALDPIEVLAVLARSHEAIVDQGRALRNEVEHLSARVEALKRDEKNAKARLRNAEHPNLKQARQALAEAERAFFVADEALRKLGLDESDSKLHRQLRDAWIRCSRAAAALRPAAATPAR